ncbi:MAG: hypothetical protein Edafosvirus10_18 [Edafosvirus sp.]|uniref:Uncharacterized protein n=1 Tax=Edafosvirus sp. TaxID=2487765 RepID=A0A3G4ZXM2_9VIRU|nr:MAG: hypothetical protein Edafosvirus10_18 [Edafosvirus sp.]
METKTTKTPIDFNSINFRAYYKLSNASLWQIVMALQKILDNQNESSDFYQKMYKKWFNEHIPIIITEFKKLLNYTNGTDEKNVRLINLGGDVDGKIPVSVFMNYHHKIQLGNSGKFGVFIDAIMQRIDFILTRDQPILYQTNELFSKYFETLRDELKEFQKVIEGKQIEWIILQKSIKLMLKND